MHAELSQEQRQALHELGNNPIRVVDPESQRTYVLLADEEFERMQANLPAQGAPNPAENGVPPGIRAAQEAYWRDLPELLKLASPDRQWVAYTGQQRVGFAATVAELYQECARRGIPTDQFYVDRLEPRELPPWAEEVIEIHFETEPPPGCSACR